MGKAAKAKRKHRFDPLARGKAAADSMDVEGGDTGPSKPLSAHQQRHFERKRLQAEAQALKQQRRKVSKGDKLEAKRQKKELTKSLNAVKLKAAANRMAQVARGADVDAGGCCNGMGVGTAAPQTFVFSLPPPRGGADAIAG